LDVAITQKRKSEIKTSASSLGLLMKLKFLDQTLGAKVDFGEAADERCLAGQPDIQD
jgi:hypothetical protein